MTDAPYTPRFTPSPDGLTAEFYRHLAGGTLRLQRCGGCGVWRHPPRIMCGRCGSEAWTWTAACGRGVVYTWTVTHQALFPPFAEDVPYAVVVVELEEGPRMVTAVRGIAPEALRLELPVEVRIVRASDAIGLHYFVPRMTRLAYLHGFASGPGSTKAQFFRSRFADAGRELAVPDLAPDFTHMTIGSMLAIVDAILDAGPTVLLGSSLGGYLATIAAARRPDRVPSLVLMAPAFGFADRWERSAGERAMAGWRRRGTANVFHYGRKRDEPLSIALLDEARLHPDEPDPACPTLVLHGRRDDAVPLAASEAFVARRPERRRLVVYDAGHELTEVLDAMWDETRRFLEEALAA